MRIMQILSGPDLNGAVLYALKISELLAARGHEIILLRRPQLDDAVPMLGQYERIDCSFKRTPSEIRRVGALCAERKIDVVHTHMSSAHAFGALLRLFYRVPCVATAHKLNFQLHWTVNDRVLCHNEESLRYMRRVNFVPQSRLRLVRPFIDESEMTWPREDRTTTLARFGLTADRPMLLTVGNFQPRKGLIDVIEALPRIVAAGFEPQVVFCGWQGEADYVAEVNARIAALGLARLVTWFERVSNEDRVHLTRCADLFVQASRVETGPLSALEAMAHAAPLVGTTCGTMRDFVVDNVTGRLFPVADPDAMAAAVIAALSDRAATRTMGGAGQARFLEMFSAAKNIGLIEQAYAESCARDR